MPHLQGVETLNTQPKSEEPLYATFTKRGTLKPPQPIRAESLSIYRV